MDFASEERLTVVDHPLIKHKLSVIRNEDTPDYLIAVHAQMGNGSSGNQVQHAVEHAKACTQNGNNHRLDAPDGFTFTRGNRRFHLDRAR